MSTEKSAMQGGYCQLDKDGNVVQEHQTKPRPSKKEQREADAAAAADRKARRPKDPQAPAETNTTGEQQS